MKLKQSSLLSCSAVAACFRIMCFYCPTSGTVTRTGTLALQGRVSKGNVVGRTKVRQKTSCDTQLSWGEGLPGVRYSAKPIVDLSSTRIT